MLTIQKITSLDSFEALASDWNSLAPRARFHTVFQLHQWYATWWQVFGQGKQLYILLVTHDDDLIGIAPLMRFNKHSLAFIGTGNSDYSDFIIDRTYHQEALQAIIDYLRDNRKDWSAITLNQVSERSGTIALLRELLPSIGAPFRIQPSDYCYRYEYTEEESKRSQFDAGLGNYRNLRNAIHFYNRLGGLHYSSIITSQEMERRLPEFFLFHWRRWSGTPTPSKFLNTRDREFYYQLVRTFALEGIARLETLAIPNQAVAYVFSFAYNNSIYLYTAALNVVYKKKSPGILLYYRISDYYVRSGVDVVDYLRGGEQYKGRLTNRSDWNFQVTVYDNGLKYRLANAYSAFKDSHLGRQLIQIEALKSLYVYASNYKAVHGWHRLCCAVVQSCYKRVFDVCCMLKWEFRDTRAVCPPRCSIDLLELSVCEIDRVFAFYGAEMTSHKAEVIKRRFASGADCFAAEHNGVIVAMMFGEYNESYLWSIDETVRLGESEVAQVDLMTVPEFRGLGIMPCLAAWAMDKWVEKGLTAVAFTLHNNTAVFSTMKANGGVVTGRYWSVRVFGREIYRKRSRA